MLWQNNKGSNICWILLWNYIFWSIPSILVHFEYSLLKDLVNYSVQTGGLGDKHSKTNYAHLWYQHQTPLIFDWSSFHFWYSTKTSDIIHQIVLQWNWIKIWKLIFRKQLDLCECQSENNFRAKTIVRSETIVRAKTIRSVWVSERSPSQMWNKTGNGQRKNKWGNTQKFSCLPNWSQEQFRQQ